MQAAKHLRLALTTRQMRYGPRAMITTETQLLLADALKGSTCPACMDEAEMLSARAQVGHDTGCVLDGADKSSPCWSDSLEAPHGSLVSTTYSDMSLLCALHRDRQEGETLRASIAQSVHRELSCISAPHNAAAALQPQEKKVSATAAFMEKTDVLAEAISDASSCTDSMPRLASQPFHIPSYGGLQSPNCGGRSSEEISRFDIRPQGLGILPKSVTFNTETPRTASEWEGSSPFRRLSSTSTVSQAL